MDPQAERTAAREEVERRWRPRIDRDQRLAPLVTAADAHHEPFHRWLPFRQGFSPGLIRLFLETNPDMAGQSQDAPVLDPFSGSGTTVIECGRRGVAAVGVDLSPALAFLANARFERAFTSFPAIDGVVAWIDLAPRLVEPLHRAALMLAYGRQHTTSGEPNRGAKPIEAQLTEVIAMIRDDLRKPIPRSNEVIAGDARDLSHLDDGSIGGVVTSPPYLSRHDYDRIAAPYHEVWSHWYGQSTVTQDSEAHEDASPASSSGVAAHPRARVQPVAFNELPPAAAEACETLRAAGEGRLAKVTASYFVDMGRVLDELARVLRPGAPCWIVIGGARLKGVYIPADLIVADLAEARGLHVEEACSARDLIHARRKFGAIGHVGPREMVLALRAG